MPVAVAVTLDAGWHVNAHEPLDPFLIPTVLEVASVEGIAVEGIVYPGPETLTTAFSAEPLAVYGGTFHVGLALALAPESRALTAFCVRAAARSSFRLLEKRSKSQRISLRSRSCPSCESERLMPSWRVRMA